MISRKKTSPEQALQKLKQYCAYQERCHREVREKLSGLGVWKKDQDEIVATLITEGYLNEERFAIAFAGGRFRMKQWGRRLIRQALQQRGVSEYCIRKALQQLDAGDYAALLRRLAEKKYRALKSDMPAIRKKKTMDYLLRKGYEPGEVVRAFGDLGIR